MSLNLKFDYTHISSFVNDDIINQLQPEVDTAHEMLSNKTGKGSDFLGWLDLPFNSDAIVSEVIEVADRIKDKADTLVCVGIGGSYLGAKAVIEALQPKKGVEIVYAGHNIDSTSLSRLLKTLKDRKYCVNVISKSGTTLEPAVTFRIIKDNMKKKARKRIVATTDKAEGALKRMADAEGYKTFIIPDDVGGRFSVLTPVGLLPIAAAGVDIQALMQGAKDCAEAISQPDLSTNPSYRYAAIRSALYRAGTRIEILANFNPALHYISEWWKQLYGESEGKENKGLFPASVDFTTDLHSLGQYIQEGQRLIMETFLLVEKSKKQIQVPPDKNNYDGLNYLAGKSMDEINDNAYQGTALAHKDGGVPNMAIIMPELNAYNLGQLIYFFEKAVAISGYLLGVNPFDQPGVEAYKNNMFSLLGKPKAK
ncbi:glucose-6-phosphate isomerase [candidate division KSB1 bacterium]|nr:glucose-6-phosphate isomerase [candidate division KSB1 bacterium]